MYDQEGDRERLPKTYLQSQYRVVVPFKDPVIEGAGAVGVMGAVGTVGVGPVGPPT